MASPPQPPHSQTTSQPTSPINAATTLPSEVPVPIEHLPPPPGPTPASKNKFVQKILNLFQPKLKDPKPRGVKKEEDALNKIMVEESVKTAGKEDALGVSAKHTLAEPGNAL